MRTKRTSRQIGGKLVDTSGLAGEGLLAARSLWAALNGRSYEAPPADTMLGQLTRYITSENKNFQPMGANMGLLPPLEAPVRDKRLRYLALAQRATGAMERWAAQTEK